MEYFMTCEFGRPYFTWSQMYAFGAIVCEPSMKRMIHVQSLACPAGRAAPVDLLGSAWPSVKAPVAAPSLFVLRAAYHSVPLKASTPPHQPPGSSSSSILERTQILSVAFLNTLPCFPQHPTASTWRHQSQGALAFDSAYLNS